MQIVSTALLLPILQTTHSVQISYGAYVLRSLIIKIMEATLMHSSYVSTLQPSPAGELSTCK